MRIFLLTFVLGLAPLNAAITIVQQAHVSASTGSNPYTATFSASPSSSNIIVLMGLEGFSGSTNTIQSVTGATFSNITTCTQNGVVVEVWLGTNPTSTNIAVTFGLTPNVFNYGQVIVAEVSGLTSTVDGTPACGGGQGANVSAGNLTTSNSNDLFLALAYLNEGTYGGSNYPYSPSVGTVFTGDNSASSASLYLILSLPNSTNYLH